MNISTTSTKSKEDSSQSSTRTSPSPIISSKADIQDYKKEENMSLESWIKLYGPNMLKDALSRLRIDMNSLSKVDLSTMSGSEVSKEKKDVKNELKNYDLTFKKYFGREPSRNEKEPMRPLYVYYKKLKAVIIKHEEKEKVTKTQTSEGSRGSSVESMQTPELKPKITMPIQKGSPSISTSVPTGSSAGKDKDMLLFDMDSKDRGSITPQPRPANLTTEQILKQLDELKHQRNTLRDKLYQYQQEFTKSNNRKIKFHKDIVPVENEYKRYKEVKREMAKLESYLL
jgi:hypothetical protein